MSQTDGQAALAAATEIIVTAMTYNENMVGLTQNDIEQSVISMASRFALWLKQVQQQGPRTQADSFDEFGRLTPGVDFARRRPPTAPVYAGPHTLSVDLRTPSGKFACVCGEAWPCSQREPERVADAATQPLDMVNRQDYT